VHTFPVIPHHQNKKKGGGIHAQHTALEHFTGLQSLEGAAHHS